MHASGFCFLCKTGGSQMMHAVPRKTAMHAFLIFAQTLVLLATHTCFSKK